MSSALRELLREKLEGFRDMQRFIVAYSGGADSHVLLHALASLELPQEILALHVNHGLSPNADNWQLHCESVARALHVDFCAERASVNAQHLATQRHVDWPDACGCITTTRSKIDPRTATFFDSSRSLCLMGN